MDKINSLITNVKNPCDVLTNDCIELLTILCQSLGISYGEANVYLFIILIPGLLLYFITTTLICVHTSNKSVIKVIKIVSYTVLVLLSILVVFLVLCVVSHVFLTVKSENMILG